MLFNDADYIIEFCEAAVESFTEFSSKYETFLLARDETNFRKNGHKMKPVAQMIGVQEMVDEYEHAKKLLHESAGDERMQESADKIQAMSRQVITDLEELIHNPTA